ncbi:hypothetical protein JCM8547_002474 [Rhodosporidiobolus lusitaniae]
MGVKGEPGAESQEHEDGGAVKPEATKHSITINFWDQDSVTMNVKSTTRFEKIFNAVAKHKGIAVGSFKLTMDGNRITTDDTPASLEMEEEEQVDCHVEQVGGGGRARR